MIYTLIARGDCILAESTIPETTGNFSQIAQQILDKLAQQQSSSFNQLNEEKISFSQPPYLYHCYQTDNQMIYMTMAEEKNGRRMPFVMMQEIKEAFESKYSLESIKQFPSFGAQEFSHYLLQKMEEYNTEKRDPMKKVQSELSQVQSVMIQNIEKVLQRGDHLELLVTKTDSLNQVAFQFKKTSTHLKRQMWWKNTKLMIILAVVGVLLIYFCISAACGFPGWQKCLKKD